MKTSEIFRRVRTHLGAGEKGMPMHKRYVCHALTELYLRGMIGDRDRTKGKRLMRQHLDDTGTLERWLWDKHNIVPQYTPRYIRKIMATRKAWLTHLIEHYEAKGD